MAGPEGAQRSLKELERAWTASQSVERRLKHHGHPLHRQVPALTAAQYSLAPGCMALTGNKA